jgi:hypothetical protein
MTVEWILVVIGSAMIQVVGLGVLLFCYRSIVRMSRDASGLSLQEDPKTRAKIDELLRSVLTGRG